MNIVDDLIIFVGFLRENFLNDLILIPILILSGKKYIDYSLNNKNRRYTAHLQNEGNKRERRIQKLEELYETLINHYLPIIEMKDDLLNKLSCNYSFLELDDYVNKSYKFDKQLHIASTGKLVILAQIYLGSLTRQRTITTTLKEIDEEESIIASNLKISQQFDTQKLQDKLLSFKKEFEEYMHYIEDEIKKEISSPIHQ